jgi:signal transduction histidine kinase
MRKIIHLGILLCSFCTVLSQVTINADSLRNAIQKSKDDTSKVGGLLKLEKYYFDSDPDSALYFNQQCEKLIDKLNANTYRHACYYEMVRLYHAKNEYRTALDYCLKGIAVDKQTGDRFQQAVLYRALFNLYHNLNVNDSAVKYGVYAQQLTEEIGDTTNIAVNYGNLCWLYNDLRQLGKAIDYGMKGIAAGKKYNDTKGLLICMNNTAQCYMAQSDYPKATDMFKQQIAVAKKVNRIISIRKALINLGSIYFEIGNKMALDSTARELNALNSEGMGTNRKDICYHYIVNGYNLIYQQKFTEAETQFQAALAIALKDSFTSVLLDIYGSLSRLKYAQHDFVAGNSYDAKWDEVDEAQHEQELAEYGLDLDVKYRTEKKEAQLKLQQSQIRQKQFLNYLLGSIAVTVLLISLLGYRSYRQKQKIQQHRIAELETQQQLTATEAVLKGEEQERTRLAKDLHDGLGGMLSGIKYSFNTMKGNLVMTPENTQAFERSMDMLDSSIKEMRRVAHNMMPEALVKFGLETALKDFCSEINQSGALAINYQSYGLEGVQIEQTISITIYRIVQELINNTMKHAAAKTAIVQVTKSNDRLTVTVEDDGKGFDPGILTQAKGIGWTNIESRINFLKGKLDIDTQEGKGTSVLIELNI